MIASGVNIVTARHGDKRGGLAVAWAAQTAPDRVLVCVGRQSATRALILASGAFGLSVLAREQLNIAKHFGTRSGRDTDKFQGLAWHEGETGSPLLDDCAATLDCRVGEVFDAEGGHKLIIGKVVACERLWKDYEPLIYREEDY